MGRGVSALLVLLGIWGCFLKPAVEEVVDKYLDCGDLSKGFARLHCDKCNKDYLLAFVCKGRWFCPSCHQKKVLLFGEFITDSVVYPLPHRQYVFSRKHGVKTPDEARALADKMWQACGRN